MKIGDLTKVDGAFDGIIISPTHNTHKLALVCYYNKISLKWVQAWLDYDRLEVINESR